MISTLLHTKCFLTLRKLLPLLFLLFAVKANALIVTGPDSVCAHQSIAYSVPSGAATYNWSVTGGNVTAGGTTNAATISWGNAGVGTIIVTTTVPTNSYTLTVAIQPNPTPAITHPPYPGCATSANPNGSLPQHEGGNDCQKVCKGNTVTYSTLLNAGSTYQWVVSGHSNIVISNNSATVTWDTTTYGSLVVIETNQWGCVDSNKICIEKVNLPVAFFTSQSNACKYTSVPFNNFSTNATAFQWYFGDGGSSTNASPSHAYSSPGNYTITLITTNACHCVDTFQRTINIDSMPGPDITCPSTLCAYDTATYSTAASGGCIYNWFAIGGTIIAGQGTPSVTVAWGAGQLGTLGLYITGCNTLCGDTTLISIPIVPANAVISGPSRICAGDCGTFTLPRFSGAGYTWTLNSNCGGTQSDTVCCEKVEICYPPFANCNDTLFVSYYDTFLGCGGSGMKVIRVRPHLTVIGNTTVCANSSTNYFVMGGYTCLWTLSPAGPTVTPAGPQSNVFINWNNVPGTYVLTVKPVPFTQVCDDSIQMIITVVAPPIKPVIIGDTVICVNSTVQYCANSTNTISWVITGGTPTTGSGNCITVNWGNTPPFIVKAYQTDNTSPFCSSDTAVQNVYPAVLGTPSVTAPLTGCANSNSNFVCTTLYPSGTTYTWSIIPTNAGAVITGQGTPSCTVQWGNNAPQIVSVKLTVNACNTLLSKTVTLTLNPVPVFTVAQIGSLCPGGSAQLQGSVASYTYSWSGPSGYTSNANPATIFLAGQYQVTATDLNGCTALSQILVQNVSGPTASISSLSSLHYCIGGAAPAVSICALGNANYTYSWNVGGPTTQCRSFNAAGSYNVTITDITNNCTALSNTIVVTVDSCNGGGPGSCTSNGFVDFTHTNCNPISFTNTSVNTNGNYSWNFGDLSVSNLTNPTHSYAQAGYYVVSLSAYVYNTAHTDSCLVTDTAQIEIPIVANFDFTYGCYNDPVCFKDKSTHTINNNILSWYWDFGDGNNSPAQNPCHIYGAGGTYYVSLVITNGVCFDTIIDTVVIRNRPNAAFSFSNPSCVNIPVVYTDLSSSFITYWSWHFGDGGTSLNQNPQHTYGSPGTYIDTLIVHDDRGCYDTAVKAITINAPVNYGNITAYPDTIVCAGTPVLLVAPTCGTCTYLWSFNNLTNDSIIVNTTGIYSVTLNDGSGCAYSTFIRIIVNSGPPAIILNTGKDELCLGEYTTLFVPLNINWTYAWTSNDPNANGQTGNMVYPGSTPPGTYTYTVIITDTTTGCADTSLPYIIIVHPLPVPPTITALGPITICFGDTVTLVGTHPDSTVTFLWNTGDINDTIFVTKNDCYNLTVKDTNGCKNSALQCVTVNPLPDICTFYEGCFDTCSPYLIRGPYGVGYTYLWLMNGLSTGVTTQNYLATISGTYAVIVTNSFGCVDTTGDLNLTLYACPDSLCADLIIDSVACDSGQYILHYHVLNQSQIAVTQVNLEILPPHLNVAYAPNLIFVNIPSGGGSSGPLTATIYNANAGDTLCFRSHILAYDSLGHELICCYSDTQCVTLPTCDSIPTDTNCCYFNYLGDSSWCEQTPTGNLFHFQMRINGCGTLQMQTGPNTSIIGSNPLVMNGSTVIVNGTYSPSSPSDTIVCITFVMGNAGVYCKDTMICINLHCARPVQPYCNLHFEDSICVGQTTSYNYVGNPAGLTFNWQFPGGSPSTATGPGPHYVTYNTVGCFQVICIINNNIDCLDTICILPPPVASITQTGNTLLAYPSGYSYQWYSGGFPGAVLLAGQTNQFYNSTVTGLYCVIVSRNYYCSDTACIDMTYNSIDELTESSWNIYPNPNEGAFSLKINSTVAETVELRVTNTIGEVVDRRTYETHTGEQYFYISNHSFATGIYFVQLKTERGVGLRRMVVK